MLSALEIPALVIRASESDMFAPETLAKVRAANPRIAAIELAGSHDLAGDNPDGLGRAVRDFLMRDRSRHDRRTADLIQRRKRHGWSCSSAKSAATFLCCRGLLVAAAVTLSASLTAQAQDQLKLAVGAPNNWENQPAALGQQAGIFKKHGLVLDLLFTQGSGETMQAVIAGSVDIGTGVGTYGAMGAFSRARPCVRSATRRPAPTISIGTCGRTLRSARSRMRRARPSLFPATGSSTNVIVLGLIKEAGVALKPTATGSPG